MRERQREKGRERGGETTQHPSHGSHRNQIQPLRIAIFINNLCYFISGMSDNVFFRLALGRGLKAGGWLNNENGLRGNEELRLSVSEL